MSTLTKAELADILTEKINKLSRQNAKILVELFFEQIKDALVTGDEVKISGFGNFKLRDKSQRPGRNPKTGKKVAITARRVVTFHPSQKLKGKIDKDLPHE